MKTRKKQELFQKYLSGRASDKEVDLLMRLIDEGGTDDLGPQAEIIWNESHLFPQMEVEVTERLTNRIAASLDQMKEQNLPKTLRVMPYWLRVAAVLVPVAVFSVVFYLIKGKETSLVATEQVETITYVEKINPKGQKSTIILSDGSVVTLNADSKLVYQERFEGKERKVTLEGEAFFDVTKDPSRPFIIETEQLITRVLGTSFTVRAYPNAEGVKVAVATGKVSVEKAGGKKSGNDGETLVLVPGEMGVFEKLHRTLNKESFDERDLFEWKEGLIYFENAEFGEVLERLEQWYGVSIKVEKRISLEKDFSGAYKNKPLELVLEGLAFVYDFEYEIKSKTVRIY
ncbi:MULTISPECIES: FecR family protein [unclassified Imperialibacter]|uniref:FecR family protein n=1 Tax=unclassified Imperialibacter TaxID=2629706 RepID=UPI001252E77D|nr:MULTISPECIES: FecR family protein [unclassified Imperialibacter]CAD5278635.1 hypothetical protein IMPERIA89_450107 [Imperialibacter sp. 89]CAD5292781.1 hypothetical protein IMPERIA75_650106 [Imperialibacter sp. 75]VVS99457.1 hypothetical protein IMPR6_100086 [Imperialibacter sp. EC-SDR9]